MKLTILAASAALALAAAAPARADNFNFTIVGTSDPGTVTGEIFGLSATNGVPTEIKIFSSTGPTAPASYDFTTSNSTFSGSFTDSSGVITAANNVIVRANNGGDPEVFFNYTGSGFSLNGYGDAATRDGELNNGGFAGATYTLAPSVSAAPEPSTWALLLGGVGILGAMLRAGYARRREDELKSIAAA